MSQAVGEFEFDPELIPEAPELPLEQEIVLEIKAAERKTKTNDEGQRSIWIAIRVASPDLIGSQLVFVSLWVTEPYKGKAHKSFANFLKALGLPNTTQAQDLVGVRFAGKVRKQTKNPNFLELYEVSGKA